jgi:hypothetical protein
MRGWWTIVATTLVACEKHVPTPQPAPTTTVAAAESSAPVAPSQSVAEPPPPLTSPIRVTHVQPLRLEVFEKGRYVRVPYHLTVLAAGPPKASLAGRARCHSGDETLVDDDMRFDELERLAPGESMGLYADFFAYPEIDPAPRRCSIVFTYQPNGRWEREPNALVAAFCVDTEKVVEGECKE